MASTYLSKTFTAGNRKTWTFSAWVKRAAIPASSNNNLFRWNTDDASRATFQFQNNSLLIQFANSGSFQYNSGATTRLFRDTSAWYHIVLAVDTTDATQADRVKLYINGEQITLSPSTNISQNTDTNVNTGLCQIGADRDTGSPTVYFDGLMAHVHFIDGTAYAASAFGETESTSGIWKPKSSPSVTYGTNGFFLKFQDSSSLGDDSSGNTNDFTLSGSGKQILDTPSNVFATWNPLNKTVASFSNGNLSCTTSTGEFGSASTLGVSQGKYYAEFKVTGSNYLVLGVADENGVIYSSNNNISSGKTGATGSIGFPVFLGVYRINNSNTSYGSSFAQNDIASIAIDCDNQKIYLAKNGTWQNSADPVAGTGGIDVSSVLTGSDWFFTIGDDTNTLGSSADANFGNGYFGTTAISSAENDDAGYGKFEYDVPAGYYALCTKNINNYG